MKVPLSRTRWSKIQITFVSNNKVVRILAMSLQVSDIALLELDVTAKELFDSGVSFLNLPNQNAEFSWQRAESFGGHVFSGKGMYLRSGQILEQGSTSLDERSHMNMMLGHTISVTEGFSGSPIQIGNTLACVESAEGGRPITHNFCSRIDFLRNCYNDRGHFEWNPQSRSRGCLQSYKAAQKRL